MDTQQLEQIGDQLRNLGHQRRQLVERIVSEMDEGDLSSSLDLYRELSEVSEQAISLMQKQKEMIDQEVSRYNN